MKVNQVNSESWNKSDFRMGLSKYGLDEETVNTIISIFDLDEKSSRVSQEQFEYAIQQMQEKQRV